MNTTHIGIKSMAEDSRFEHGPVLAKVDGNRVILTRRHRDGSYPVISDEIIPDEYLSIIMADLKPIK